MKFEPNPPHLELYRPPGELSTKIDVTSIIFEAITFLVYRFACVEWTLEKFSKHSIAFH